MYRGLLVSGVGPCPIQTSCTGVVRSRTSGPDDRDVSDGDGRDPTVGRTKTVEVNRFFPTTECGVRT